MVNPERQYNAFAALDILARADSTAFAAARNDASATVPQLVQGLSKQELFNVADFLGIDGNTLSDLQIMQKVAANLGSNTDVAVKKLQRVLGSGWRANGVARNDGGPGSGPQPGGGGASDKAATAKKHHAEGNRLTEIAQTYQKRGDKKMADRTMGAAREQYKLAEKARK